MVLIEGYKMKDSLKKIQDISVILDIFIIYSFLDQVCNVAH